jgi:hypothetical protein
MCGLGTCFKLAHSSCFRRDLSILCASQEQEMEVHNDQETVLKLGLEKSYCDGNLKVIDMGTVVDNTKFWDEKAIFPVGYKAQRMYRSIKDPNRKSKYICEVLNKDGEPVFRVTALADDESTVVVKEGKTPSQAWAEIRSMMRDVQGAQVDGSAATPSGELQRSMCTSEVMEEDDEDDEMQVDSGDDAKKKGAKQHRLNGLELFGLNQKEVLDLIALLPEAEQVSS